MTSIHAFHAMQHLTVQGSLIWISWLVLGILITLAIFLVYISFQNARPFRIESRSSLPPEDVLNILQSRFAQDGWLLGYRDTSSLVMSIDRRANPGSAAMPGCFSLWLGLIYWIASSSRFTANTKVFKSAMGAPLVASGSKTGQNLLRYIAQLLQDLPKQSESYQRSRCSTVSRGRRPRLSDPLFISGAA